MTYFRRLPFIETTFCALANASSRATLLLGLADKRIAANSSSALHICACSGCDAAVCTGKLNSSERARSVGESLHSNVPAVAPPLAARASQRPVERPSSRSLASLHVDLLSATDRIGCGQGAGRGLQSSAKRLAFVSRGQSVQERRIVRIKFPFRRDAIRPGLSIAAEVVNRRAHSSAPSVVVFQP